MPSLNSFPIRYKEKPYDDSYILWVEAPEIAHDAYPGQFVTVGCDGLMLRRPLSVHRVKGEMIALMFSATGTGTQWLSKRKEGERLNLLGPLGRGFELPPSLTHILLIGGGRGIFPLIFLSEWALDRGFRVSLILGAKTREKLYPAHLVPCGVNLSLITEDGPYGNRGKVTDLLPHSGEVNYIYACGPSSMYRQLKLWGKKVQVLLEVRMGCGVGACHCCTINTRRGPKKVCQDGPMFFLDDILWDGLNL